MKCRIYGTYALSGKPQIWGNQRINDSDSYMRLFTFPCALGRPAGSLQNKILFLTHFCRCVHFAAPLSQFADCKICAHCVLDLLSRITHKKKEQIRRFLCRESKKWISFLHYLDYISPYSLCYFYKIFCILYILLYVRAFYISTEFCVFGIILKFSRRIWHIWHREDVEEKCCDTLRDFGNTFGIFFSVAIRKRQIKSIEL